METQSKSSLYSQLETPDYLSFTNDSLQAMDYHELYQYSINEKEKFWAEQALMLKWFKEPSTILSKDEKGFYHWFADGEMNTCYLCLDFHVEQGRGEQTALIYDSPVSGVVKKYSYSDLKNAVAKFAGGLQSLGITKGDTVVIYIPNLYKLTY